jgi:hypothetical protein
MAVRTGRAAGCGHGSGGRTPNSGFRDPVTTGDFLMKIPPRFPEFKTIETDDRPWIQEVLDAYRPETSEWTFTNLFIWRSHYNFRWSWMENLLVVVGDSDEGGRFALQPVGPGPRGDATGEILDWMAREWGISDPRIQRADRRLASELEGDGRFIVEPTREHFDYVYRTRDLVELAGRKYDGKRNHINRFRRTYRFEYAPLGEVHRRACLELSDSWCRWRRCEEDLNLLGELEAIREVLTHLDRLPVEGGVILVDGRVEAFALGELLNEETVVIHVEKGNPELPGTYAVINQQFCEHRWSGVPWVNREQDLGEPGLRKAKLSYHPDHLVEKYQIRRAG